MARGESLTRFPQQGRGKGAAFKRQRLSVGGAGPERAGGGDGSCSSSSSSRRRGTKPKVKRHGPGASDTSKDDDSDDHRATIVITNVKDEFMLTQVQHVLKCELAALRT